MRVRFAVSIKTHGAAVGVAARLAVEPHLENKETKHGSHHDNTGHRRVLIGEQIRKAWIRQVSKCHGEQMYEGRGNQDTSSKMFTHEECLLGDIQPLDLLRGYWKASSKERSSKDNKQSGDMKGKIIFANLLSAAALGLLVGDSVGHGALRVRCIFVSSTINPIFQSFKGRATPSHSPGEIIDLF
jgi:hypothetical protein